MEAVFFPLDEELNLPQSGLTPHVHQGLVLLGSLVPFASTAKHLETLLKGHVSPNCIRRLTEQAGEVLEQWQNQHAQPGSEGGPQEVWGERLAVATDGVLIPVLPNEWAEIKMTTIGEVGRTKDGQPHSEQLSYFARLADADTFGDLASFERRRRGVDQARAVAAVNDGAEWIQGFVQSHRADAVRILDFAHAAQYVGEIATLAEQAGVTRPANWFAEQLKALKEQGPAGVLTEVRRLEELVPSDEIREKVAYLSKREGQMQYPQYLDEGWPIGSGMAESGNKLVVQVRLKGAGMHWQRQHVNPMLAVRSRLDWKYALSLEITDPGFDHTVLSEFRTRLVALTAEERFLEAVLALCKEHGWLKAHGRQRTDSTHILAKVRAHNPR